MEDKIRIHAIIKGRVQGVFFRQETKRTAEACNVTGWVKNLPDGTVEAVLEGNRDDVEKVVRWCHQGPPAATVTEVNISQFPYTGEFDGFVVRF